MKDCFSHRCHLGIGPRMQVLLSALVLVVVAAGAGGIGVWYGQSRPAGLLAEPIRTALLEDPAPSAQGDAKGIVEDSQQENTSEFNALNHKLGQLQAEILRLNALGERLVEKAGLSTEEFDFRTPPPQGGPVPLVTGRSSAEELAREMSHLSKELKDRGHKLRLLDQLNLERELVDEGLHAGLPVRSGYISSYFGLRHDPIHGRPSFHTGIDYAGKIGSDILAVAEGLVIFSEHASGYGRTVEIRHFNGLVTRYAHCKKRLVEVGDLVAKGQVIATLGSSGRSTGPHLHFEVLRDGEAIDPMRLAGLLLPQPDS